jgi:putative transposase
MPWKKSLVSEERAQFVLTAKSESESFVSMCGRFGISRKTGYKWLQRYRRGGLKALADMSRRPHHRGKMHHIAWRMRLRALRQEHPRWGAKKLRRLLQKAFPQARRLPAVSTLARWLVELHLVKKRQRRARRGPVLPWRGVHAPKGCNQVWTIDFKGWFRTGDGQRCEPLTVRDLFSRYVLSVALLPNQSDAAVRRVMRQVFRRYGLPKVIRVDNGAPFGGKGALGLSRLSVWWLRLGITVEFVRPAHPQDNGAHEQMHRVLRADVATPPAPSVAAQKRRIGAWISCYNHQRPHEALGQRVPGQIYWPSNRPMPEQLIKASYPSAWHTRRVRNRGHIKWRGRERFIGRAFVGELVGLKPIADNTPRSLSPWPSHRLALRTRSSRNATGLDRAPSLSLCACPPP